MTVAPAHGRRLPPAARRRALAPVLALAFLVAGGVAAQTHGPSVDIRSKNTNPPRYPTAAVQAGADGTVQVRVSVDATGRLTDAQVEQSSGNADLDASAIDAAHRWRYAPGRRDGEPEAGTLLIPVDYRLGP